jgi:hypothetical protein
VRPTPIIPTFSNKVGNTSRPPPNNYKVFRYIPVGKAEISTNVEPLQIIHDPIKVEETDLMALLSQVDQNA